MKVSVTFRHMEGSDAVREHIDAHLENLKKFLIKPTSATIILDVEKFRQTAEVLVQEQSFQAKAIETTDDMYASIDKAFTKIETQLRKHKEKLQEHHKHHSSTHDVAAQAERDYEREQGS